MRRPYNPSATREALKEAATELFARHGYKGTTVEMIARKAKANKALINYHFGGKRKLYLAIAQGLLSTVLEQLEGIRRSPDPAEAKLRAFVQNFDRAVRLAPTIPAMIIREAVAGGEHLDVKLLPHFLKVFALVREILEQGIEEGAFRATHPLATHLSLIGSMVFFYATVGFRGRMLQAHGGRDIPSEEFVRHTQELFVRGLLAAPAPPGTTRKADGNAAPGRS